MNANTSEQQHGSPPSLDPSLTSAWRGAWYAAPMQMQPAHLTGRTLAQIVHLHEWTLSVAIGKAKPDLPPTGVQMDNLCERAARGRCWLHLHGGCVPRSSPT